MVKPPGGVSPFRAIASASWPSFLDSPGVEERLAPGRRVIWPVDWLAPSGCRFGHRAVRQAPPSGARPVGTPSRGSTRTGSRLTRILLPVTQHARPPAPRLSGGLHGAGAVEAGAHSSHAGRLPGHRRRRRTVGVGAVTQDSGHVAAQHSTAPPVVTAHVCWSPAEICAPTPDRPSGSTRNRRKVLVPSPSCPSARCHPSSARPPRW